MTATVMGRVLDDVRAERRQRVDLVRVLLTALTLVPFVLGWLVGALWHLVCSVTAWTWAAMAVGYRTARGDQDESDPT